MQKPQWLHILFLRAPYYNDTIDCTGAQSPILINQAPTVQASLIVTLINPFKMGPILNIKGP